MGSCWSRCTRPPASWAGPGRRDGWTASGARSRRAGGSCPAGERNCRGSGAACVPTRPERRRTRGPARHHLTRARDGVGALPDDGYGAMIRAGIDRCGERLDLGGRS
ncbi:hypothetical protein FVA95_00645 [Pseudonocardia sp. EV170527-09]|nr:hypothetical protein FVA95_00645 [Pseudonocardia sp. EV170527-09]